MAQKAQHAILRFAKHKAGPAGALEAHHERTKEQYASNPDIDTSKSKDNFHIIQPTQKYRKEIDTRIKAAGCVLPLSNNLDLGKDMGTRHRACLGIAENSDAIAIVVSEETGIISMAKNGVLIRHFDRQTLYTRLVDEMIPKEAASDKGRSFDTFKGQVLSLMDWRKKEGEGK